MIIKFAPEPLISLWARAMMRRRRGGDDDGDDDVVAVDVDAARDAPDVAARTTPVAPAPMPAARIAEKIRRRTRPFVMDAICSLLSPGSIAAGSERQPRHCPHRP
jgi:hypothetical protein